MVFAKNHVEFILFYNIYINETLPTFLDTLKHGQLTWMLALNVSINVKHVRQYSCFKPLWLFNIATFIWTPHLVNFKNSRNYNCCNVNKCTEITKQTYRSSDTSTLPQNKLWYVKRSDCLPVLKQPIANVVRITSPFIGSHTSCDWTTWSSKTITCRPSSG